MKLASLMNKLSALVDENPEYIELPVIIVSVHEDAEEARTVRVGYSTSYESDILIELDDVESFCEAAEYDDENEMVADTGYRKIIMIN